MTELVLDFNMRLDVRLTRKSSSIKAVHIHISIRDWEVCGKKAYVKLMKVDTQWNEVIFEDN